MVHKPAPVRWSLERVGVLFAARTQLASPQTRAAHPTCAPAAASATILRIDGKPRTDRKMESVSSPALCLSSDPDLPSSSYFQVSLISASSFCLRFDPYVLWALVVIGPAPSLTILIEREESQVPCCRGFGQVLAREGNSWKHLLCYGFF